jgi:hypothetical protein
LHFPRSSWRGFSSSWPSRGGLLAVVVHKSPCLAILSCTPLSTTPLYVLSSFLVFCNSGDERTMVVGE